MADKENQFQGVVESLLKGMDTVLSTKTVVGEATKIGDTIILPLVDVTFGVGAGAGNNSEKKSASGAGGLGGKMTPSGSGHQKRFHQAGKYQESGYSHQDSGYDSRYRR